MSRDLKPTERLVQIGQTALRAPDGSFLPAQPLYIIVEAAPMTLSLPARQAVQRGRRRASDRRIWHLRQEVCAVRSGAAVIGSLHSLSGNYKKGGFPP